jgi:hypothetical protein
MFTKGLPDYMKVIVHYTKCVNIHTILFYEKPKAIDDDVFDRAILEKIIPFQAGSSEEIGVVVDKGHFAKILDRSVSRCVIYLAVKVCRVVGDARKPALNTQQRRSAGFSLNTNNGGKSLRI